MPETLPGKTFELLSGTAPDDARDAAEPRNFLRHALSLAMTKTADGLIDPKLVLSWLLTTLGAPVFFVGLLVPIREAGALVPQLAIADRVQRMRQRKWAWVTGSAVQGIAAGLIALAAVVLSGWAAGVAICVLLGVLALARSVCSVSYKDILGKTVGKTRRGAATGTASSVASAGVIVFALMLMLAPVARMSLVIGALVLAAGLWLAAAALLSGLKEEASETTEPQGGPFWSRFRLLREDPQLGRFVAARGLLIATAIAPPYLVVLASADGDSAFGQLGALVLASSIASLLSSYVWGRLSDRSSRLVLIRAGLFAAASLGLAVVLSGLGVMADWWAAPLVLFLLMVAYHGVRQGRSTYLVDMAPSDRRSEYTAVANTAVGILLMAGGLFGALAAMAGTITVVAVFAGMSLAAAWVAHGLDEVER